MLQFLEDGSALRTSRHRMCALVVDAPDPHLEAHRHGTVVAIGDVGADVEMSVPALGEAAKFLKGIHMGFTVLADASGLPGSLGRASWMEVAVTTPSTFFPWTTARSPRATSACLPTTPPTVIRVWGVNE